MMDVGPFTERELEHLWSRASAHPKDLNCQDILRLLAMLNAKEKKLAKTIEALEWYAALVDLPGSRSELARTAIRALAEIRCGSV